MIELDERGEKRQTSLSFSLSIQFFSKDADNRVKIFVDGLLFYGGTGKKNQSRYSMQINIDYSTCVLSLLFAYGSIVICKKEDIFVLNNSLV